MGSEAPGLENGLRILEMVAEGSGVGFNQLKKDLGLSPASLNRYLKTLMQRRYIEKNENQLYGMGSRLTELRKDSDKEFLSFVHPVLESVSNETGATSLFICFKQGKMVCFGKHMVPEGLSMQTVGEERTDYIVQPWGFLFLAGLAPERRNFFINNANVHKQFEKSVPNNKRLDSFLQQAEQLGCADDKGMILTNIRRFAAPVFSGESKLLGAIGIGMLDDNFQEQKVESILNILKQKARILSEIV